MRGEEGATKLYVVFAKAAFFPASVVISPYSNLRETTRRHEHLGMLLKDK